MFGFDRWYLRLWKPIVPGLSEGRSREFSVDERVESTVSGEIVTVTLILRLLPT